MHHADGLSLGSRDLRAPHQDRSCVRTVKEGRSRGAEPLGTQALVAMLGKLGRTESDVATHILGARSLWVYTRRRIPHDADSAAVV